ncbi:MAG: tRNA (adenosine(37)-N6)-threonylcarbamoyltransferase complex ATPase subunit type 1 TsaE [Pirellulaceae bacterium]|nr:tRNA (adenosine(37)-N6)-threonylcarbamoyltransferase complex ATPase subunit type 1 TsaE [Pirellulaceae bacterium]
MADLAQTDQLSARLASSLTQPGRLPMMLALCGPLGAGKTQFVRSLAVHLGIRAEAVTSPTYILVQRYRGTIELIHLDYYRLRSAAEAWDLGLDEWLVEPALTIIEWAEKFPETWPDETIRCDFSIEANDVRCVKISSQGPLAAKICQLLDT